MKAFRLAQYDLRGSGGVAARLTWESNRHTYSDIKWPISLLATEGMQARACV